VCLLPLSSKMILQLNQWVFLLHLVYYLMLLSSNALPSTSILGNITPNHFGKYQDALPNNLVKAGMILQLNQWVFLLHLVYYLMLLLSE
jgi:hypothetical protein